MNSFYTENELKKLGFKNIGINVLISRNAKFYNIKNITIGDNVRIDDFCILSGKIELGNFIHISAGCYLFAGFIGIKIEDYSSLSSRCALYAITDDYSGNYMTNSMVNESVRNVISKAILIKRYVVVGTDVTILPGVIIEEGCAIGAMSLLNKSLDSWGIYFGIPAKRVSERHKDLLDKITLLN